MPKTNTEYLRSRLEPTPLRPSLHELRRTEWSKEFEDLRRNRMIMGSFRYESLETQKKSDHRYMLIEDAIRRLEKYQKEGNVEHLLDVANLCMIEYVAPSNPKAHFESVDDGEHCPKR